MLSLAGVARAAETLRVTEPLWPQGAPGAVGAEEGDVPQLILTRVAHTAPGAAVVILPGGGYHGHALDHEGHQFADWFERLGLTSAICTYRVRGQGNAGQGYGHPAPLQDAQRAIQALRARADALHLDPQRIGVIGFSAGGHLAATVANQVLDADPSAADPVRRVSSRPDFCILCYPVIAFDRPHTHRGSQQNLLGPHPDPQLLERLSGERQVTARTPPTFLFHTGEDLGVPVENAIDYYLACRRHGVAAELHVFPEGRHGLGLASAVPGPHQWPELCRHWLHRLGMTGEAATRSPQG